MRAALLIGMPHVLSYQQLAQLTAKQHVATVFAARGFVLPCSAWCSARASQGEAGPACVLPVAPEHDVTCVAAYVRSTR